MTFVSCAEPPKGVIDWEAVAETITQRMSLQSGERVLLLGRAGQFDDLVPSLRAAVEAAGAVDLGALSVSSERFAGSESPFVRQAETGDRAALKELFRDVDIAVMLPGAALSDPAYAAMQDLLGEGHGRTIHFHWSGAYDLNGNAIAVTDVVSAAYQTALLETDYAALSALQ